MPEPLAIYGATNASYGLAKELYGYIESWAKADKRAKSIELRFGWTQPQLKFFTDYFEKNEQHIPDEALKQSIVLASTKLKVTLDETKGKIAKYDPRTWRRVQWPWIEKSLDEAEKALADWVLRMYISFSCFSPEMRERAAKQIGQLDRADVEAMSPLREYIDMIKKQDAHEDDSAAAAEPCDEPDDFDEENEYYWKDIIEVPLHIRGDERLFKDFKKEVVRLARVLERDNARLTCIPVALSWFERTSIGQNPTEFGIAYKIPQSVYIDAHKEEKTYTLKEAVSVPAKHELNARFDVASQVVSAIAYVHSLQWVHKSLRSQNILLIYPQNDNGFPLKLGEVRLKGFGVARRGTGEVSSRNAPQENRMHWQWQIYAHPNRQFINLDKDEDEFFDAQTTLQPATNDPDMAPPPADRSPVQSTPHHEYFKYKHDIYSLGVVLLEIGIWQDLERYCPGLKDQYPKDRRRDLLETAEEELASSMGSRYANVVKACLDVDNSRWDAFRVLDELSSIKI